VLLASAPALTRVQEEKDARRARRQERYETVMRLHAQGVSIREIGRMLGMGRHTIRTFIQTGAFPERRTRYWGNTPEPVRSVPPGALECRQPACPDLVQGTQSSWIHRIGAHPTRSCGALARGTSAAGATTQTSPAPTRAAPAPPVVRVFSVRQATWLMLRPPADLDREEQLYLDELLRLCPPAATACRLARAFFVLVRERDAVGLDAWLTDAAHYALPEMQSCARGIRRDRVAVDTRLSLAWSNGQTEGFVNKLKMLKR